MEAQPVLTDAVRKSCPSSSIWQFKYSPSPSRIDSNLIVFLHGLGDCHIPFFNLGKSLQKTLPQTAILALRAPTPIPLFADSGEEAWCWWDSLDPLGQGESQSIETGVSWLT